MNIKELRMKTGLTQTKFGELFRIPMRTIQNWENGTNKPPEWAIYLLEIAVTQYLGGNDMTTTHKEAKAKITYDARANQFLVEIFGECVSNGYTNYYVDNVAEYTKIVDTFRRLGYILVTE